LSAEEKLRAVKGDLDASVEVNNLCSPEIIEKSRLVDRLILAFYKKIEQDDSSASFHEDNKKDA
jgi:hypothetical protein